MSRPDMCSNIQYASERKSSFNCNHIHKMLVYVFANYLLKCFSSEIVREIRAAGTRCSLKLLFFFFFLGDISLVDHPWLLSECDSRTKASLLRYSCRPCSRCFSCCGDCVLDAAMAVPLGFSTCFFFLLFSSSVCERLQQWRILLMCFNVWRFFFNKNISSGHHFYIYAVFVVHAVRASARVPNILVQTLAWTRIPHCLVILCRNVAFLHVGVRRVSVWVRLCIFSVFTFTSHHSQTFSMLQVAMKFERQCSFLQLQKNYEQRQLRRRYCRRRCRRWSATVDVIVVQVPSFLKCFRCVPCAWWCMGVCERAKKPVG